MKVRLVRQFGRWWIVFPELFVIRQLEDPVTATQIQRVMYRILRLNKSYKYARIVWKMWKARGFPDNFTINLNI